MSTAERALALRPSANDRFKEGFGALFWGCVALAVAIHFVIIAAWPTMNAADLSVTTSAMQTIDLPPEIEIPKAPPPIVRPAVPVVGSAALDENLTIAATTFDANPIEKLPPPANTTQAADLAAAPHFTPYEVAPDLINRSEVAQALLKYYPPLLLQSGIGGRVKLWFYIDTEGRVLRTQVVESSGYPQLDAAAQQVAAMMRFSPALNRDQKIPVWVQLPVVFESIY
ncbi:MAG: TonB family protein [Gemmatimonadota bacterium]|jgi:protein TonB